jgi:hypothetical protein
MGEYMTFFDRDNIKFLYPLKLGSSRSRFHRLLCSFVALCLMCTAFGILAQTPAAYLNLEHEAHVEEAKKLGTDPLDLARSKTKNGVWTIHQYISFSKFNREKQDAELAQRVAKNAKLDAELKESTDKLENTTRLLVRRYGELLTLFESLKVRNMITAVEVGKIRNIYNDTAIPPDMRQRIEMNFGTELKLYSK